MIRKILAKESVKRFIRNHTTRLYCRIYGHTYLISYTNKLDCNMVNHRCWCYQCRDIYGDLDFPMYLFAVKSLINPQYRSALEAWLKEINISPEDIEQLIKHLQRDRIAKIINSKRSKLAKGLGR